MKVPPPLPFLNSQTQCISSTAVASLFNTLLLAQKLHIHVNGSPVGTKLKMKVMKNPAFFFIVYASMLLSLLFCTPKMEPMRTPKRWLYL